MKSKAEESVAHLPRSGRGKKRKCGWLQTILMVLVCLIAMFTQLSAIVSTKYLVDTLLKAGRRRPRSA